MFERFQSINLEVRLLVLNIFWCFIIRFWMEFFLFIFGWFVASFRDEIDFGVWILHLKTWIHLFFLILYACMLSHFSHVQLCATPRTTAHGTPLSMGFSRQEYWSGLPYPSQGMFPTQVSNPHLLCLLFGRQVLYH